MDFPILCIHNNKVTKVNSTKVIRFFFFFLRVWETYVGVHIRYLRGWEDGEEELWNIKLDGQMFMTLQVCLLVCVFL